METKAIVRSMLELWDRVICAAMIFAVYVDKDLRYEEKKVHVNMYSSTMAYLLSDAPAWIFRGREGPLGYIKER